MTNKSNLIGKRILSGITPSGDGSLHIGNYLGAVRQFIEIAKNNECFLFVADLHALTTVQDKDKLAKNIEQLILNELALLSGLGDLKNVTFFRQSDVPEHTQLQTILNNLTPLGLIKRAHAYKDKLAKDIMEEDINMGLFNYPILMASDILLYKPDYVPVGKDQKQHIEIARDIAERFNKTFKKNIFPLPDPYIPVEVATVLGTDGKRKMSKSLGNIISIFEDENVIRKQVNNCYTDPTRVHANDPGHIEGNMVFTYLDFFGDSTSSRESGLRGSGKSKIDELKESYKKGQISDIEVKNYLYETLLKFFGPARLKYQELKTDPNLVKEILEKGARKAREIAGQTLKEVSEAVGLVNKYTLQLKTQNSKLKITTQNSKINQYEKNNISIEEFGRVEIRVGKVVKAENVEESQKLILLTVDFGPAPDGIGLKTIYTGVRGFGYKPEDFRDKQFLFVTNLAPRKMPGGESQGMILATSNVADSVDEKPIFIPADDLPLGSKVR